MEFFKALKQWNDFSGKTSRKSFWIFFIVFTLMGLPIGFFKSYFEIPFLSDIYFWIMLIPFVAIGFRRMNDAGLNRFLFLLPFVGLVLATFPSKSEVS